MISESSVKLKLSVWRDFIPSRALVMHKGHEDDHQVLTADSDLQQEVYCWQMREDPFDGVSEEAVRLKLRELLFDRFDASLPPSERRFSRIQAFIDAASSAIDNGEAEWTISQDAPVDDEDNPYRLNPLLALKLHLQWLSGSFAEQPGISVSIR